MTCTAGVDVGSTYTKVVLLSDAGQVLGRAMEPTGFKLGVAAERALRRVMQELGLGTDDVRYVVATGFGRHQVAVSDVQVTDLTAGARGAAFLFPGTRTILDVGGQTMKAEIGPLVSTSKEAVAISGVCAVFAESEVINQLSQGAAPADIMHGAIVSLVGRSVQLLKRVGLEPEFTLIGGILRFERMADVARAHLGASVNVPPGDMVQFVAALGAAVLGRRRLQKLAQSPAGAPN
jgi:activator of 2-hydroxyglutaryl-CoA dehydratase